MSWICPSCGTENRDYFGSCSNVDEEYVCAQTKPRPELSADPLFDSLLIRVPALDEHEEAVLARTGVDVDPYEQARERYTDHDLEPR